MSASQSNLSGYGYDIVVATTEKSINATLKYDLRHHHFPVVRGYFVAGENGKTEAITYDNLLVRTKGTDPLKIDNYKIDSSNQEVIANVVNSKLVYAFEAAIGVPPKMLPVNIPDIITLAVDGQSVNFNMICAQFTILALNGTNTNEPYVKFIQPDNASWLITFIVALKAITGNNNLPPELQQKLDTLGPEFSVQQLILDIGNAPTDGSRAKISGVPPDGILYRVLTELLNNNFLGDLKSSNQPVFFYAFTKNSPGEKSSLVLSDMKVSFSPYSDPNNPKLSTLNYLCATNGNPLPQPKPLGWNWVDPLGQGEVPDGVIAINRNTFAKYFQDLLTPSISENCLLPYVKVVVDGGYTVFSCSFSRNQTPKAEITASGAKALNFSYSKNAIDGAGAGDSLGELGFSTTCNASVTFSGNTIIIEQSMLLHVDLWSLATNLTWNAINKSIKDTYTLAVDQNGGLTASLKTESSDKSQAHPTVSSFTDWFTSINEIADYVTRSIQAFVPTSIQDIPISTIQQFVFPGGQAFTFKKVGFSDYQDLVTEITYVQPG